MRMFYDSEQEDVVSEKTLKRQYFRLKMGGGTEAETFVHYLSNCLDKNGTLTEINLIKELLEIVNRL